MAKIVIELEDHDDGLGVLITCEPGLPDDLEDATPAQLALVAMQNGLRAWADEHFETVEHTRCDTSDLARWPVTDGERDHGC